MDHADELVDQAAAASYKRILYHKVDGKTKIFAQVRDDASDDASEAASDDHDTSRHFQKLGVAEEDPLQHTVGFPVMVAYIVGGDVEGLKNAERITNSELHSTLFTTFTNDQIQAVKDQTDFSSLKDDELAIANAALEKATMFVPDNQSLLEKIHLHLLAHPDLVNPITGTLSVNNIKFVHRQFRNVYKWTVSQERIKKLIITSHQVTSFGELAVTQKQLDAAAAEEAMREYLRALPQRKEKNAKVELSEEQKAQKDLAKLEKRTRNMPPPTSYRELYGAQKPYCQNEDTSVYLQLTMDMRYKSFIRFTHKFNYIDPAAQLEVFGGLYVILSAFTEQRNEEGTGIYSNSSTGLSNNTS